MFYGLYNIIFTERNGSSIDLHFLQQAGWLMNTAIRWQVSYIKGRWHVAMLLVWAANPLRFLRRQIDHYETEKKAIIHAKLFKRTMQKDERGTIKINEHDFNICYN